MKRIFSAIFIIALAITTWVIIGNAALEDNPLTVDVNGPITAASNSSSTNEWKNKAPDARPSFWVSATRYDADGNVIGNIYFGGSRWHVGVVVNDDGHEVDSVKYSIDANATGAAGKANASVVAPGKRRKHDQKGRGEHHVSWNNPNLPSGMYAIDTSTRSTHGVGNRTMEATASLSQAGEPRVSIQVTLTGI